MHPKSTWTLVTLSVVMFAFIFFYERHLTDPPRPSTKVLTDFKAADVTSVQILPVGIRAEYTNGAWQLSEPLAYPARAAAIDELLNGLEALSYQLRITPAEMKNAKSGAEYGFDSPSATVILQSNSGMRVLKFGGRTPPGDQVYMQLVAREGIDVVSADVLKFIPHRANDWRDTQFANLKALPDRLAVTNGGKNLELQRDPANGRWRMAQPMVARAYNSKINELLSSLQSVRVSRFETDDAKADFESFGLQPPRWQLTLAQGSNTVVAFQFGNSPTNDDTQVFARVAGQYTVVQVPRGALDGWCDDYEKFRDPHLASLSSGALDVIEITGAENFSLERFTNDLWVVSTKTRRMKADTAVVRKFIEDVAKMKVVPISGQFARDAVTDVDLSGYGLATPARTCVFMRAKAGFTFPIASTNLTVETELQFGAEKEGKVFARRPEERSVYAVDTAEFQKLPSRSLDFVNRSVWNFTENDIQRFITRVEGKTTKYAHSGTNKWFVEAGQEIINTFAVEAAAAEFGALQAEKWIDCAGTNRSQYGFSEKSPQISAQHFGGDNAPVYTLELGGWSPDHHRYGGVQSGNEYWVFELSDDQMQRILPALNIREKGP